MRAGIDFGTTFSLIARLQPDGSPALIPDSTFKQKTSTPSSIYLGDGAALVGWQAEGKFEQSPEQVRLLTYFKRQFGSPEPLAFDAADNAWHPEGLAALVLKKLRFDAEIYAGEALRSVVMTVPAHFNDLQRKSAQNAAVIADLPLADLLDEPVAAAMHYGIRASEAGGEKVIFVYDLGGGTFDATALTFDEKGIYVLAKDGHTNLGGREFDDILQNMIADQIRREAGNAFTWSSFALLQLRKAAEEVKIELSEPGKFFIRKNILVGSWRKEMTFNRRDFGAQAQPLLEQTIEISRRCLFEAGLQAAQVDAFLLVGGSSMMPAVRETLAAGLNVPLEKVKLHQPLSAVAFGAALRAAQLSGEAQALHLPAEFRGVTGYHVGFRTVDPLTGQVRVDTVLRKNLPLPCKGMRTYYTRTDAQQMVLLELVQFMDDPANAVQVGQLSVGPIARLGPNYAVEVTVENTADGRLHVRAFDPQTGREVRHTFQNSDEEAAMLLRQKALVAGTMVN